MNIALFQIDFPLQSYSVDFITVLLAQGHSVTLYASRPCDAGFVDLERLPGGSVVILDESPLHQFLDKVWRTLHHRTGGRIPAISPLTKRRALTEAQHRRHDLYVGIEKKGLIAAGWVARRLGRRCVYYSLELNLEGHPLEVHFRALFAEERHFHRLAAATIIQDSRRAEVLLAANGLPATSRCLFLPVGVRKTATLGRQSWFHKQLGIPRGVRIVLYFGLLTKRRDCQGLIDAAALLGSGFVLVLHGPVEGELPVVTTDNACLSTALVAADELPTLVASADIGIALYGNEVPNDRFTAFSSQKVAMYLRAGVPFIARRNESYEALRNEYCCCALIDDPSELPVAVATIAEDYDSYAEAARRAFDRYFCLENTLPPVARSLEEIVERGQSVAADHC